MPSDKGVPVPRKATPRPRLYRHDLPTRLWHWLNALAVSIMVGSGLTISNAHRRLYWGQYGADPDRGWFDPPFFPAWATIPSRYNLAYGRRWHLLFALVLAFGLLVFMISGVVSQHFARDYRVGSSELAPRELWADIKAHLVLRFRDPHRPGAYNTLQKAAYGMTVFGLIPLMILSGLALSPGMDAVFPWLPDIFGGRGSARSVHFIGCWAIVGFVAVHLALVVLAGPLEEIWGMITGWSKEPEGAE